MEEYGIIHLKGTRLNTIMTRLQQLYEQDFYTWAHQNADLLRERQFDSMDINHLITELELMGESERRVLESRLEVLLAHLLKWQYQTKKRSRSWNLTLKEQRRKLSHHLAQNPGLKNPRVLTDTFNKAYSYAVLTAARETGFEESIFPEQCPYSLTQVLDEIFYPE